MNPIFPHRTAVILSIGDELVLGQTTDTNSAWISGVLTERGVGILRHVTVDDDLGRLKRAIEDGMADADLLLMTGGLGPTADDLTREALAEATEDDLVLDEAAESALRAWFGGRPMPEANRVQATRPGRSRCLPNPHGTAPGIALTHSNCDVFAFPGPPSEMKPMLMACMLPMLRPTQIVRTAVLHTVGLGESAIAARLGDLMDRSRNPVVGTTASGGIVSVRIRSSGAVATEVADALDLTADTVRDCLGSLVINATESNSSTSERGVHALVRELLGLLSGKDQTIAVCESCTAGLLSGTIADVPGSSDAMVGGFVTYSNDLKTRLAGVPQSLLEQFGAVSREVAESMASGTLERTNASHALAVTGIAGPGGGSEAKPVGTVWIALASEGLPVDTRCFRFKSDRPVVRSRSVVAALSMLRQRLLGLDDSLLGQLSSAAD